LRCFSVFRCLSRKRWSRDVHLRWTLLLPKRWVLDTRK
jgi:hypothetical protein